jgi:hypothetical protein
VAYAVVYLRNPTSRPIEAVLELASDDSILVKLDDCELFRRSVARWFGDPGTVQDAVAVEIAPGPHRLLVKAFNGGGDFGFRLRFRDRATGSVLTDASETALEAGLDPAALGLAALPPVGLALSRQLDPPVVIGLDRICAVAITAQSTFAELDGGLRVLLREELPAGVRLVAGSARPPPTTVAGRTLSWDLQVRDALRGLRYEIAFEREVTASILGSFEVESDPRCAQAVGGTEQVSARRLDGVHLGDLVGGGDGTGTKPPEIVGINIDTGKFETTHLRGEVARGQDPAQKNLLAPVTESPWVDSVFFLYAWQVNSFGAQFVFGPDVAEGISWDRILSNRTHNERFQTREMHLQGRDLATAVGVHASAGVTFDLHAIRERHGPQSARFFSVLAGMEDVTVCGASMRCAVPQDCGRSTLFIIYSNETEVLSQHTWIRRFQSGEAEEYEAAVPARARFLTLATGRDDATLDCAHGVFGEPRLLPLPVAAFIRGDADASGAVNLSDGIYILNFLFRSGPEPPCGDAADTDNDGSLGISDAIYLFNHLFLGAPPPPAPGLSCGPDPEGLSDGLTCNSYEPCARKGP